MSTIRAYTDQLMCSMIVHLRNHTHTEHITPPYGQADSNTLILSDTHYATSQILLLVTTLKPGIIPLRLVE